MFLDADLAKAARNGETQRTLDIIRSKNVPDTKDEQWALHNAIGGGQIETVKALLRLNVPLGQWEWMSILNSAATESIEMVTLIAGHIQDLDELVAEWTAGRVFYRHCNSLISAAHGSSLQTIEYFLAQGAGLEYENDLGKTALFYAAGEGTKEAVSLLLDYGASINHRDIEGNTPLFDSLTKMNSITTPNRGTTDELLIRRADVSLFNNHNFSPLRIALKRERLRTAEKFIQYGASLSETDSQGLTTRDWAIEIANPRVVQWLNQPSFSFVDSQR